MVALVVAWRGLKDALETRRAMVRDRQADLLVRLIHAVEADRRQTEYVRGWDAGSPPIVRSVEAASLCHALWGRRTLFGTTWHLYCQDDQTWTEGLWDLYPRMRGELQSALDKLNHEDAKAIRGARSRPWASGPRHARAALVARMSHAERSGTPETASDLRGCRLPRLDSNQEQGLPKLLASAPSVSACGLDKRSWPQTSCFGCWPQDGRRTFVGHHRRPRPHMDKVAGQLDEHTTLPQRLDRRFR